MEAVRQAESQGFQVEVGSVVDVEPVLPGCDCYPPRGSIPVTDPTAPAEFWVVPRILGRVRKTMPQADEKQLRLLVK